MKNEALDTAILTRDERVLERIRHIQHINESEAYKKHNVVLTDAEKAMSVINVFYEERCNGLKELSKTLYDILIENKQIVEQHIAATDISDKNEYHRYTLAIENAQDILDCTPLTKHIR